MLNMIQNYISNIMEVSNYIMCKTCDKMILYKNHKKHCLTKIHINRSQIIKLYNKFEIIDKITNSIHIIDPYFMIYFEKLEKEIKKYNINII